MNKCTPMCAWHATAIATVIATSVLFAPAAVAYQGNHYRYEQQPDESGLDNHGHYTNRDGNTIHSPAHSRSGTVPQGASAQCRDGTYSFSRHHSGTCSRHGGVAAWQ